MSGTKAGSFGGLRLVLNERQIILGSGFLKKPSAIDILSMEGDVFLRRETTGSKIGRKIGIDEAGCRGQNKYQLAPGRLRNTHVTRPGRI